MAHHSLLWFALVHFEYILPLYLNGKTQFAPPAFPPKVPTKRKMQSCGEEFYTEKFKYEFDIFKIPVVTKRNTKNRSGKNVTGEQQESKCVPVRIGLPAKIKAAF